MTYPSRFTEFFGPNLWKVMHAVSFTYPKTPTDEQAQQYKDFFHSLGDVIPCPGCRVHYKKYLEEHPIKLNNSDALSRWVYDLHDTVNRRNKKSSPSYDEIKDDYAVYDEKKDNYFNSLSGDNQRLALADPFFGRVGNVGNVGGVGGGQYETKVLFVLVAALLGAYGLYTLKKMRGSGSSEDSTSVAKN